MPILSEPEVAKCLKDFKKRGGVKGDIFPQLVTNATALSVPLTNMYNHVSRILEWPKVLKTEFVTPIPKPNLSHSPNDLQNISCTLVFCNVYESFALNWLTGQVGLKHNQYAGVSGSGLEHLLVRMWQDVLESIEDPRAADFY